PSRAPSRPSARARRSASRRRGPRAPVGSAPVRCRRRAAPAAALGLGRSRSSPRERASRLLREAHPEAARGGIVVHPPERSSLSSALACDALFLGTVGSPDLHELQRPVLHQPDTGGVVLVLRGEPLQGSRLLHLQ